MIGGVEEDGVAGGGLEVEREMTARAVSGTGFECQEGRFESPHVILPMLFRPALLERRYEEEEEEKEEREEKNKIAIEADEV